MGAVIVFANPKGGSGKSTSAMLLAEQLSEHGNRVTVLDADPNRSIYRWLAARKKMGMPLPFAVEHESNSETMTGIIRKLAKENDYVLVDLEGAASQLVSRAIARAHLVLIPMMQSPLDSTMAENAVRLVRVEEEVLEREIPFRILFQGVNPAFATTIERQIEEFIAERGYPIINRRLALRSGPYKQIFARAMLLSELEAEADTKQARDSIAKAREEARAVTTEVVEVLRQVASQSAA